MLLTKDKDDLQLIERFFERELTEQELADFEVRLKADDDFAERVERFSYAHRQVEQIYYPNEREAFKKKWEDILNTDENTLPKNIKSLRYYLIRVAAAILLILGLALIINEFGSSNDNLQQIALRNWEPPEPNMGGKVVTRNKTINSTVIWNNVEKAYKEGRFVEALGLLNIFEDDPDALFWKGNCHFELRQMPQAISDFEAVIQHQEGSKKDLARWYQALAYIYENNTDAARKKLNIIIENNYPKADDATQLLEQL